MSNDVIVKCGNQSGATVFNFGDPIRPGTETDWNGGAAPWRFAARAALELRPDDSKVGIRAYVSLFNPLIGYPTAFVALYPRSYSSDNPPDPVRVLMDTERMAEGRIVTCDCPEFGFRILIHRGTNEKEQLDDYDEWYTRFYVAIQNR